MDKLTTEIVKKILNNVGVTDNLSIQVGLMDKNLLLNESLKIQYDDEQILHDVYVGKIHLNENYIKGLLVNLCIDNMHEYLFLFRMNKSLIHAAYIIYNSNNIIESSGFLKIYDFKTENWIEATTIRKAKLLAEFEELVSLGFLWEDCLEYDDLYEAAIQLINLQKG